MHIVATLVIAVCWLVATWSALAGELVVIESTESTLKPGQIVDASIVRVSERRNRRGEHEAIKSGEVPGAWKAKPRQRAQKDVDARWTKKHGKSHTESGGQSSQRESLTGNAGVGESGWRFPDKTL